MTGSCTDTFLKSNFKIFMDITIEKFDASVTRWKIVTHQGIVK